MNFVALGYEGKAKGGSVKDRSWGSEWYGSGTCLFFSMGY